jgi:hypothetical protein
MYLHYHKNNFYWFKGLNVKRIIKMISSFEITDKLISYVEHSDKRKIVKSNFDDLFLINLFAGNNIVKLLSFYKDKNINLIPINQKFPLTISCLTEDNNYGLDLHCDTTGINTYREPRYFGCNIYLNDDYNGGELIFPLMNLKIKPEIGDLITYRSDIQFPHYVKKVTYNKKWLLQGYFRPRGENE